MGSKGAAEAVSRQAPRVTENVKRGQNMLSIEEH